MGHSFTFCQTCETPLDCDFCDKLTALLEPGHMTLEELKAEAKRQCYHERNRYMVLSSDRVIAVYDGRSTGGTFYTIRFAQANEKEIRIIEI